MKVDEDDQQHSSTSYKSNIKWAMESIANIQAPTKPAILPAT